MLITIVDTNKKKYTKEVAMNTRIEDVICEYVEFLPYKVLLAKVDNQYRDLNHKITHPCCIELLDMRDNYAWLVYQNTLVFVYKKAIYDVLGEVEVVVSNSLNKGLYTHIKTNINKEMVEKIEARMRALIASKMKITKTYVNKEELINHTSDFTYKDTFKFIETIEDLKDVEIFTLDHYSDLFYGLLLPNTSYITHFELVKYHNGIIIRYPHITNIDTMPPYEDQKLLYDAFSEATRWERLLDVRYVKDLNRSIKNGSYKDLILLQEALLEKKISDIADRIKNENKHVVLISGPSSSGKTTTAKKLCMHLRVIGLKTLYLGTDDYFLDRGETPLDENGEKDFENVTAIDIPLFNQQVNALLEGKKVDIPIFNFVSGNKEFGKRITSIDQSYVIVIEGTHALNEVLTSQIREEEKFKLYISPLTSLNISSHNRIPTTDARMLRRLVRDARSRGCDALRTIRDWQKVRRGEDKYIFPYIDEADAFLNTNYIYELAVLKKYAQPLLESIKREEKEYGEAQRMLSFLRYFVTLEDDSMIANTSILREFIGGSILEDKE